MIVPCGGKALEAHALDDQTRPPTEQAWVVDIVLWQSQTYTPAGQAWVVDGCSSAHTQAGAVTAKLTPLQNRQLWWSDCVLHVALSQACDCPPQPTCMTGMLGGACRSQRHQLCTVAVSPGSAVV